MSAATDTLMSGAGCINLCIPDGMKLAVLIKIFAGIANMSTNTNTLIADAVCIDNCIPDGMKMGVLISLATQIVSGGGGGGSAGLYGSGSPQGVTTANPGTTYWDQTGTALWIKDNGTGNTGWIQLI